MKMAMAVEMMIGMNMDMHIEVEMDMAMVIDSGMDVEMEVAESSPNLTQGPPQHASAHCNATGDEHERAIDDAFMSELARPSLAHLASTQTISTPPNTKQPHTTPPKIVPPVRIQPYPSYLRTKPQSIASHSFSHL